MNVIKEEYYIKKLPEISIFIYSSYYNLMIHTATIKVNESFWEHNKYS